MLQLKEEGCLLAPHKAVGTNYCTRGMLMGTTQGNGSSKLSALSEEFG